MNRSTASIHFYILVNSGGSTISFIDTDFTILYYFSLQELKNPFILNIINSYIIESGAFTHYIKLPIRISYYIKQYIFLLTKLDYYSVVLDIK